MKNSLLIGLLFLVSCKELPKFPADSIFEYIPKTGECYEYKVIKNDPLTFDDGKLVATDLCSPSLMGFQIDDVGPVMNWIRNAQTTAKTRCK